VAIWGTCRSNLRIDVTQLSDAVLGFLFQGLHVLMQLEHSVLQACFRFWIRPRDHFVDDLLRLNLRRLEIVKAFASAFGRRCCTFYSSRVRRCRPHGSFVSIFLLALGYTVFLRCCRRLTAQMHVADVKWAVAGERWNNHPVNVRVPLIEAFDYRIERATSGFDEPPGD
jgi:hypothetical protein